MQRNILHVPSFCARYRNVCIQTERHETRHEERMDAPMRKDKNEKEGHPVKRRRREGKTKKKGNRSEASTGTDQKRRKGIETVA